MDKLTEGVPCAGALDGLYNPRTRRVHADGVRFPRSPRPVLTYHLRGVVSSVVERRWLPAATRGFGNGENANGSHVPCFTQRQNSTPNRLRQTTLFPERLRQRWHPPIAKRRVTTRGTSARIAPTGLRRTMTRRPRSRLLASYATSARRSVITGTVARLFCYG
jgi:hypothetical protein